MIYCAGNIGFLCCTKRSIVGWVHSLSSNYWSIMQNHLGVSEDELVVILRQRYRKLRLLSCLTNKVCLADCARYSGSMQRLFQTVQWCRHCIILWWSMLEGLWAIFTQCIASKRTEACETALSYVMKCHFLADPAPDFRLVFDFKFFLYLEYIYFKRI